MMGRSGWGALVLALVIATMVGVVSYNAGVSHGLAVAPSAATSAPPAGAVPYGYYRPWGWGWGFGPLFFLGFWFVMIALFRGFFWGSYYRRCGYGPGWRGTPDAFEEWHRRAHAEMNNKS